MRLAKVGVILVLVSAACSSGTGGSDSSGSSIQPGADASDSDATGTQAGSGTASSGPAGTQTGIETIDPEPILFVVTAHDVDERGVPVDPALEFAADDPQISVVVLVGDVEAGTRLEVGWTWLDGPDGEQPLFGHELDVDGGDVAFSHGIATGPLAAGRYRASVSGGGSTEDVLFAVRPTPIAFPELVSNFARAPELEDPFPPSSGPSGTIPSPHDYAASANCLPWVYLSSLLAMTGANGCGDAVGDDDNLLEVTAWVGGNAPVGLGQARGDFVKPVRADPCDLGGSDLETEPVSYAVTVISGPDEDQVFSEQGPAPEPDTHAPMAFLSSQPSPGAQVNVGDTIVVEITADDKASVDSVISGIASVTLTTDGREVDGLEFTGPVACDKDRLRRVIQLQYVVPENPPEVVTLVAAVRDYEGQQTTIQASYPTVSLWTGYMDIASSYVTEKTIDPTGGFRPVRCTLDWEFRVVFFAPSSGDLYGYADGVTTSAHECDAPGDLPDLPATRMGISGSMTPDAIMLRFEPPSGGWAGIAVLYSAPVPDVIVARSGVAQAFGEIDLTLVTESPNNSFTQTVTGRIDLGCGQC